MIYLRQNTAGQVVQTKTFLDSTDAVTPETGLTINNTDIKIYKNGTGSEVTKNSGGAAHDAGGRYTMTLDATDTNTLGSGKISIQVAGALLVSQEFVVLDAKVYDSLILGTDNLEVDLISMLGSAGSALPSTQASINALNDFNPTSDSVTVGINNDKTGYVADVAAINGDATAAVKLALSAGSMVVGIASSGTTTSVVTDLTETTNDHYAGRSIVFTSGALLGQASGITSYNGSTKTLSINLITEAPTSGITFIIV